MRSGDGVFAKLPMYISWSRQVPSQNGLKMNTNLSPLVSTFLFYVTGPGTGNAALAWFHSVARCQLCTSLVTHQEGVFCANFGKPVIGLPLCQNAWCGTCYRTRPGDDFFVYRVDDTTYEEGNVDLVAPEEEDNFKMARPGDHLFCPFECDYCVFFKLRGRSPIEGNKTDDILLTYIRRANLDAFWSRRPGTIEALVYLFKRQIQVGEQFGFEMFPPRGPFPRDYDSGMRMAIGSLWESRLPGQHEPTKKFSSCRKVRSLNTNMHNSGPSGAHDNLVLRTKNKRTVASTAPSDSEWANRFMMGFKARLGDRVRRDAALSVPQVLAFQELCEEEYLATIDTGDRVRRRQVCEIACFVLLSFCCSLRGFETPKIVLHILRTKIQWHSTAYSPAHMGVPLRGRFKARTSQVTGFLAYTALETASGIKPAAWTKRLIDVLEEEGITNGWLFQNADGSQRRMNSFANEFFAHLICISERNPDLFEKGVDILNDYGLARSARRGATTRATNAGVSKPDIDWINRWNTGGAELIDGPMAVIYSDQKQMVQTFLRFSLSL